METCEAGREYRASIENAYPLIAESASIAFFSHDDPAAYQYHMTKRSIAAGKSRFYDYIDLGDLMPGGTGFQRLKYNIIKSMTKLETNEKTYVIANTTRATQSHKLS